jgi:hypothetical protein
MVSMSAFFRTHGLMRALSETESATGPFGNWANPSETKGDQNDN